MRGTVRTGALTFWRWSATPPPTGATESSASEPLRSSVRKPSDVPAPRPEPWGGRRSGFARRSCGVFSSRRCALSRARHAQPGFARGLARSRSFDVRGPAAWPVSRVSRKSLPRSRGRPRSGCRRTSTRVWDRASSERARGRARRSSHRRQVVVGPCGHSSLTMSTEISTAGVVPLFSSQCVVFRSSGQPTPGP